MQLHQVLLGPVVTEKAVQLQESNKHVFRIHGDATKVDVMNALRKFYNATPLSVRIVKMPKKVRMIGRSKVFTKRRATKKAIVTLPQGQSIELVSVKKAKKEKASSKDSVVSSKQKK